MAYFRDTGYRSFRQAVMQPYTRTAVLCWGDGVAFASSACCRLHGFMCHYAVNVEFPFLAPQDGSNRDSGPKVDDFAARSVWRGEYLPRQVLAGEVLYLKPPDTDMCTCRLSTHQTTAVQLMHQMALPGCAKFFSLPDGHHTAQPIEAANP